LAVLTVHFWAVLEKRRDIRVNSKWRERLNELLEEKNTLHNTTTTLRERVSEFSGNVRTLTAKTAKTQNQNHDFSETRRNPTAKTVETPSEAEQLGLVAMWSIEFGYISVHDPTTGEWHDLRTEDAPGWAKREAFKRKELYKDGNRKAYCLTATEMEEVWEAERVPEPEGIVEDHPVEEEYELGTG
jgi:hypothetical protein